MSGYVDLSEHFGSVLAKDLRGMLIGDPMGYGTFRHIFNHATDEGLVVKVENGAQSFHNVAEWHAWQSVKDTKFAKWFAPCMSISASGTILIMQRAQPATSKQLPRKVPAFFTDLKAENWGIIDGRPVCVDYGLHLLHEHGMTTRLRVARWDDHG